MRPTILYIYCLLYMDVCVCMDDSCNCVFFFYFWYAQDNFASSWKLKQTFCTAMLTASQYEYRNRYGLFGLMLLLLLMLLVLLFEKPRPYDLFRWCWFFHYVPCYFLHNSVQFGSVWFSLCCLCFCIALTHVINYTTRATLSQLNLRI